MMRLEEICKGRLSSPFGWRIHPITGVREFHNGVDIAAPQGEPIYSPIEGSVRSVYRHSTGGLTIILNGGVDVRIGMCHLQSVLVGEGNQIRIGQCVGKVGRTGRVTGAHLHLTVSVEGSFVDPIKLFPK